MTAYRLKRATMRAVEIPRRPGEGFARSLRRMRNLTSCPGVYDVGEIVRASSIQTFDRQDHVLGERIIAVDRPLSPLRATSAHPYAQFSSSFVTGQFKTKLRWIPAAQWLVSSRLLFREPRSEPCRRAVS